MGQLDQDYDEFSYETRELAWELQQSYPDQQRIRFLLENEADLKGALKMARLQPKDVLKKPSLKPLQLQKLLEAEASR